MLRVVGTEIVHFRTRLPQEVCTQEIAIVKIEVNKYSIRYHLFF